jgi:lysophospholipase L1-like esterase
LSKIKKILLVALCICLPNPFFAKILNANNQDTAKNSQLFYFGTAVKPSKGTVIKTPLLYTQNSRYGFDFGSNTNVKINSNTFSTEKPTYFSAKLPEGNYSIEVTIGSKEKASNVTIKAESRRLMLNQFSVQKGNQITKTFNVNIRTPQIDATPKISLKDRDLGVFNWDDKLTLEFLGVANIQSMKITPVTTIPVIYLAGDSTVTDQDVEPWASWRQFITNYFDDKVVVANYAVSGSALSSFKASNRLKKINSLLKPGDYLFVEFAHNDEKLKGPENTAWESYSKYLEEYLETARNKESIPVLVTPTQRRAFNSDGTLNECVIKLTGWRSKSYPIRILANGKEVYKGNTAQSLGYITIPLEPVLAQNIKIELIGANTEKDGFSNIVEVEATKDLDLFKDKTAVDAKGQLRIVEIEFYEKIK